MPVVHSVHDTAADIARNLSACRVAPAGATADTVGIMARRARSRAAQDAAYRRALGVEATSPLPNSIGAAASAGGSRGGPGGSQRARGAKTHASGRVIDVPGPAVASSDVRAVRCPRCLAVPGSPCRNQWGREVRSGHGDRRRLAQSRARRSDRTRQQPPAATKQRLLPATLTSDEHAARVAEVTRQRQVPTERVEDDGRRVVPAHVAISRLRPHKLKVDNG